MFKYPVLLFLLLTIAAATAQNKPSGQKIPLTNLLQQLEHRYNIRFSYATEDIKNIQVIPPLQTGDVQKVLRQLADQTGLLFETADGKYYWISKVPVVHLGKILIRSFVTRGTYKTAQGHFVIRPGELGLLTGLIANDALKSLHFFPGVQVVSESTTDISVKGGFPDQNLIRLDGINLYHAGHLYGLISSVNPDAISSIRFYSHNYPPYCNGRLSSVIQISSADSIQQKSQALLEINSLYSGAVVSLVAPTRKWQFKTAYRTSIDQWIPSFTLRQYEKHFYRNSFFSLEKLKFHDLNGKLLYDPNTKNHFSLSFISLTDTLGSFLSRSGAYNTYRKMHTHNYGGSLQWIFRPQADWEFETRWSLSDYAMKQKEQTHFTNGSASLISKENTLTDSDFFIQARTKPSHGNFSYVAGYHLNVKTGMRKITETTRLTLILDRGWNQIYRHSFYGTLYARFHRLQANAGIRLNNFPQLKRWLWEPVFHLSYTFNKHWSLQISAERRIQEIFRLEESLLNDNSPGNFIWRLADGRQVRLATGNHFAIEGIYRRHGWISDLEIYYKRQKGITTLPLGFLGIAGQRYFHGKARISGLNYFLRKKTKHWILALNYAYERPQLFFPRINRDRYFDSPVSIRHALHIFAAYRFRHAEIAAQWNFHSGKPYMKLGNFINYMDFYNSLNRKFFPPHHHLDLSASWNFTLSRRLPLKSKITLSLYNVYNQISPTDLEVERTSTNPPRFIQRIKYSMGFTPLLSLKLIWD